MKTIAVIALLLSVIIWFLLAEHFRKKGEIGMVMFSSFLAGFCFCGALVYYIFL